MVALISQHAGIELGDARVRRALRRAEGGAAEPGKIGTTAGELPTTELERFRVKERSITPEELEDAIVEYMVITSFQNFFIFVILSEADPKFGLLLTYCTCSCQWHEAKVTWRLPQFSTGLELLRPLHQANVPT